MNPGWQQRFPLALTVFGWDEFVQWIGEHYAVGVDWLRGSTRPALLNQAEELRLLCQSRPGRNSSEEQAGVNVLGHFCYPSGLQEATRSTVRALERTGLRTSCRDVPANLTSDRPDHADYLGLELFDCTLITVAPEPLFEIAYPLSGLARREGVRRIALWYWELEAVPLEWTKHARELEEIRAPTQFIADAMCRVMPVPVVHMLPGVELKPYDRLGRAHFGLPEESCLFLFLFDMNSIMDAQESAGADRGIPPGVRSGRQRNAGHQGHSRRFRPWKPESTSAKARPPRAPSSSTA